MIPRGGTRRKAPVVLVVDDDPAMQRWVADVLQPAGFRVLAAPDALTGLGVVRKAQPDVVVLDLGLPAGGGKGFLQRLRGLATDNMTPVVVLSGKLTSGTPAELAPFGIAEIMAKPAEPARLLEAVRRAAVKPPESAPRPKGP